MCFAIENALAPMVFDEKMKVGHVFSDRNTCVGQPFHSETQGGRAYELIGNQPAS